MKKSFLISLVFTAAIAIALYAADTIKLNRLTRGIQVTGGTTSTNGKTLITSDSSTNEYSVQIVTATVAAANTVATNVFTTAFTATPTVMQGVGKTAVAGDGFTVSSTQVLVAGLSTNGAGTNSVPLIVYGTTRSGVFE